MKQSILILLISFITMYLHSQNENLSDGQYFDGEPYLAIDPHNPEHIVVAWIGFTPGSLTGIKVKASFDGGHSWSASTFLPHAATIFHSADPSIAFDTADNVYACYIDYTETPDSGAIYVVHSTDGGLTWGSQSRVIGGSDDPGKLPLDRPWFTINPVTNQFYVTSKPAPWLPPPNRAYFRTSSDEGATWASWRYIDTTGYLIGPDIAGPMITPAVGSDGVFHAIYPSYLSSQNVLPGYIHASSTNNGATFTYNSVYHSLPVTNDSLAKVGYHLEVDPTNPRHLVFNFVADPHGDLDVFILQSTNGGATWTTTPQRVNDDAIGNGKMQDMTWCTFDVNGDLIVGWRDRRDAPGTGYQQASETWGAILRKDSTNFTPNFKISDTLAQFVAAYLDTSGNDFMNIALHNDTMYAVWGDTRTGVLQIWFDMKGMSDSAATSTGIMLTDAAIPAVNISPNPSHDILYISGEKVTEVTIADMSGQTVSHQKISEQQVSISPLTPGLYTIALTTAKGTAIHKFVKD